MVKKVLNKHKTSFKIIFSILLISLFVIFIPITITFVLGLILDSTDGYLLMGLSFCIFLNIIIILIPIIFVLLITHKKDRVNNIKSFFKKYKIFSLIGILFMLFLEIGIASRGYSYYKDIRQGPNEAIMSDAIVKRESGYRTSYTYIVGNINGEKIKFTIIQDAHKKVVKNKIYKKLKIKYYKNIKGVYEIVVDEN